MCTNASRCSEIASRMEIPNVLNVRGATAQQPTPPATRKNRMRIEAPRPINTDPIESNEAFSRVSTWPQAILHCGRSAIKESTSSVAIVLSSDVNRAAKPSAPIP